MAAPNSAELQEILRDTRTVAVVGASNNPARPSYRVYQYLARFSHYELYPVNPTISDIDGTPVYPSLADLPWCPTWSTYSAATTTARRAGRYARADPPAPEIPVAATGFVA